MVLAAPVPRLASSHMGEGALRELWGAVLEFANREPLIALGILVVGVVVLVVSAVWLRRRLRSPGERFRGLIADQEAITVLTHPNPDPDAMAAAFAVTRLAEAEDTDARLCYPGEIRHQENRAFRTVLDLDCEAIDDAEDLGPNPVVLVDHNEPRGFPGAGEVAPIAVVDHHPESGGGTEFTDIRPDYGSTSTIFTEYFDQLDVERPDPQASTNGASPLDAALATGLLYGILSDTNHLTRGCSHAEFQGARYLYPAVDEDLLDRIANPQVDAEVLDVKARAINDRVVRPPFAVADVGTISNVDAIPQAADELVRLEGVSAVVVLGHRDGVCQLSGRSRDDRVHMGETLRAAVEDLPGGNAGGHARMGGGRVRLNGAPRNQLVERLFAAMNGER